MRVVHIDLGRQMRGGQWQALALAAGLGESSVLLARKDGVLLTEARERGIDVRPFSATALTSLARDCDIVHAHDARSHTWAALLGGGPLVVSRRVAFSVQTSLASRWKY